ncbi:MAG: NAD-binding protein, partial [Erysipelotrichaceae bacterium]|nr:NAD-binding protein [Erysipelotrichaceae bacterium]
DLLKDELGLSLSINPELATANSMARMLKFPSAMKVSDFGKGLVEVVTFSVDKDSILCGVYLKDIRNKLKTDTLIIAAERNHEIIIPDGNFQILEGDKLSIVADSYNATSFLQRASRKFKHISKVMIVGGGSTGYYLAEKLIETGIQVKIIEINKERCMELCDLLPKATIIHGDGTDRHLLLEEGIESMDAFVSMAKIDEENMMLSLYANTFDDLKVITRVHRPNYVDLVDKLNVGNVVYPRVEAAEIIASYVRAMNNSINSNVEALHRLLNERVEALEFWIKESSAVTGIPLKDLKTKDSVLIACIIHQGNIIIPGGMNTIEVGDSVIVTSSEQGLNDITDILR